MHKNMTFFSMLVVMLVAESAWGVDLETDWGSIGIHGFVSQGYLKSNLNEYYAETKEGTFQFNEIGLNFSVQPTDRLQGGLQFLSRDLGDMSNNQVQIDWAFLDYRWKDALGIRAGKIKIPWGFYNETRDIDMLRTSIFLPSALYEEEERDIYDAFHGLTVYGNLSGRRFGSVNYQFYYGEKGVDSDSPLAQEIEREMRTAEPGAEILSFTIHDISGVSLEWNTPVDGLRIGGTSVTYAATVRGQLKIPPAILPEFPEGGIMRIGGDMKGEAWIMSAEYTRGNLTISGEYLNDKQEETNVEGDAPRETEKEGYYVSISYRLTDRLELGAYYSASYPDKSDRAGKQYESVGLPAYLAWQKELVLTTRFDVNEHWTIKVEGHLISGVADTGWSMHYEKLDEHSFLFAAKTTVHF